MAQNAKVKFDLLGDPIPDNWGGRGRPQHIPTVQNRQRVRLLLAFGWTVPRIAASLRITGKTLRKHYFPELRQPDEARAQLEGDRLQTLYRAMADGNVGAARELGRIMDREFGYLPPGRSDRRPDAPGKKAAAVEAAQSAHEDTGWSDLLN